MKNELYELYKQCFPTSQLSKESFLEEIDYENSNIIMTQEHCHMIGASVVDKNAIRFLCIAPQMQKQGFGKELLKRSEEAIANDGYEKVIIRTSDFALDKNHTEKKLTTAQFFVQQGYKEQQYDTNIWGSKQLI